MTSPGRESLLSARPLERVYCWLNRWADLDKHREKAKPGTLAAFWVRGYEQAVNDVMAKLGPLAPDWIETWRDEEWGYHDERKYGVDGF